MNNKLVLDRGTPQYIWDKHEIDLIRKYVWGKYRVDIDYLYKWKQCYAVYSPQFYWDVYQILNTIHFTWDTYELKEIAAYYWNTYEVDDAAQYFWDKYTTTSKTEEVIGKYDYNGLFHWNEYDVADNYKYTIYHALSTIKPYLPYLSGKEIIAYNLDPNQNAGNTSKTLYSNYDIYPDFTASIVDLDLNNYDEVKLTADFRGSATAEFPVGNITLASGREGSSWKYEIKAYNSTTTYTPNKYNQIWEDISSTKRIIFVSQNNSYLVNEYYIVSDGLTTMEGNILHNILKFKYAFEKDVYYPIKTFDNHFTSLPIKIGTPTSEAVTDEIAYPECPNINCLDFINANGTVDETTDILYYVVGRYSTNTTYENYYTGFIGEKWLDYYGYYVTKEYVGLGPGIRNGYVTSGNYFNYPDYGKQSNSWYSRAGQLDNKYVTTTLIEEIPISQLSPDIVIGKINKDDENPYRGYAYESLGEKTFYTKTNFIETVSSLDMASYPADGVQDNFWYTYTTSSPIKIKGALIGEVISNSPDTYPQDDIQDNVWYEYTSGGITYEKGEATGGSVESTDGTAYPESGPQDGVWYESTGNYTTQSKGSHIEQVMSTQNNTYPEDGIQGDYWYTYNRETEGYSKGEETGTIVSSGDAAAYPNNGRLAADGFWYESIEPETSPKKGFIIGSVSANSLDAYPQDGIQGDYWYTYDYEDEPTKVVGAFVETLYSSYQYEYPINAIRGDYWYVYQGKGILLFTITDAELYGGVKYKSYINTEADWRAGTVSSASIEFTTSVPMVLGDEIQYFKRYSRDDSWSYVDNYIVDEVIKTPYQDVYKVVAYDYITLFDVYVDEWLKTLTYPITIQNLYTQLVSHIQTTSGKDLSVFKTDIGANGSIQVLHGFEGVNITGRQILQFIAEAAGRCVGMRSTEDARFIDVQAWGEAGTFDSVPSNRVSLNMSEYEIAAPTRVVVRATEDDVGGGAGSGTEGYDVVGNPLFYGVSQTTLDTAAAGILSEMTPEHNFHNGTLEMLQDYDIPINSWFRIYAADGTTDLGYFLAMGKEFDGKGVKYTCEGKATRDTQASNQNSEIIALLGKYNELKSSIDENSATIVDLTKGQSSITQRVDSISTSVSDLKGNQSSITQTVNSLNSKVTAQGNKVNSLESEINQTAEEISLKVSKNEIISAINLSSEKVDISSDKINLTGYVTATDLKTGGATTINGSNITTGTISADRINLTGAISWGDLDSFVQSEIEAGGGSVSLPSYIKTSYIGPTEIRSPSITGNDIQVYNTFQTLNSNGVVSGYMGAARGKDGYGNTTYGVAMSNSWSSNTYDVGDNYIIATNAGIRMESDENSITATDTSIHLTAKNGSIYINTPNGKAYYNGVEIGGSSGAVIPVWG